jgi:hypothetical protein
MRCFHVLHVVTLINSCVINTKACRLAATVVDLRLLRAGGMIAVILDCLLLLVVVACKRTVDSPFGVHRIAARFSAQLSMLSALCPAPSAQSPVLSAQCGQWSVLSARAQCSVRSVLSAHRSVLSAQWLVLSAA